tara:strand:- start:1794 stop:3644 length:1851 start_codon:yes stop_codon:yes gene_type:complete
MMRVLDKKLIFSVLIGIFAFYILFIFINNNQEVVDSRNLVCSENIDIENIINENENIIYSNSEISIFPNLANILCFNKIKTINFDSKYTNVEYFFSSRFHDLIFYATQLLLIVSFFHLGKKTLYHLLSSSLFILHLIAFNPLFYNLQAAYKILFLTISNNVLFYFFTKETKQNNYFDYVSLVLLFLLFNSYHVFSNLIGFYFFIFYRKNIFQERNITENYKSIIFNLPIYFYLVKLISGLSSNFSLLWKSIANNIYETSKVFGDIQIIFRTIHCNSSNFIQDFKFYPDAIHTCPFETGYPLIDYTLSFDVNNIWLTSVFVGGLTLISLSIFYRNIISANTKYSFIIFIIAISSPVNFLFDRFNLDIFIIFLSYLAIKSIKKYPIISTAVIVFLFTVKIYPIFILISSAIVQLKNKKNLKVFYTNLVGLTVSIYYFYDIVFVKNSRLTATNNPNELFQGFSHFTNDTLTFGYLAHLRFIENFFSLIPALVILLLLILLIFLLINKTQQRYVLESNDQDLQYLIVIGTFVLISLFENYDYRICFLFLAFKYIVENKNESVFLLYMTIILTSATYFSLFNTAFVLLNIVSFTILIQFFIIDYFKYLRNKNFENINKKTI